MSILETIFTINWYFKNMMVQKAKMRVEEAIVVLKLEDHHS